MSVARAKRRKVGDPFDENTEQGPQVTSDENNVNVPNELFLFLFFTDQSGTNGQDLRFD